MAIDINHAFVSAKADDVDTTIVRPSDWNADHTFTMATNKLLGRGTASTGAVEEITLGTGLSLSGTTINSSSVATITAPQGRLTLQSATPAMTTTQSAKTTIYYTPYVGDHVPIYDGASMTMTTFTELSVGTTDATKSPAAIGASKVNDWFVWSDGGTIRVGHGPDWTSDTARSAGTALVMVGGLLLNSVSITNGPAASRGTYVGTTRSNASSQLDWIFGGLAAGGTAGFFGVANAYNKVDVFTLVADSTDSWTYGTATWRSFTNMKVSYIDPLGDQFISARNHQFVTHTGGFGAVGIGIDSTTAFSGTPAATAVSVNATQIIAEYGGCPGLGFHSVNYIEYASAVQATFRGDNGLAFAQTGLHVHLKA